MKEAEQKTKIHILGFNLHKNRENANQSKVTASSPWFLVEGYKVEGGITKDKDVSEDNGYVYCYDYDYGSLGVYI